MFSFILFNGMIWGPDLDYVHIIFPGVHTWLILFLLRGLDLVDSFILPRGLDLVDLFILPRSLDLVYLFFFQNFLLHLVLFSFLLTWKYLHLYYACLLLFFQICTIWNTILFQCIINLLVHPFLLHKELQFCFGCICYIY